MIIRRMAELSISKAELSRMIGVTRAAMTALFASHTKQTRLLPVIHKALKLPVGQTYGLLMRNAETIEANFARLDDADQELVRELIDRLLSKQKS